MINNDVIFEEEKNLSQAEMIIMKVIWGIEGDVPLLELINALKTERNIDYARTTVATFLTKLSAKGFVKTYRKGKHSYIRVLKTEEEYLDKMYSEEIEFWFDGKLEKAICQMCHAKNIPDEVIKKMTDTLIAETK